MDLDQIIDNIGKLPEPSKNALKEIISEVTHPKDISYSGRTK